MNLRNTDFVLLIGICLPFFSGPLSAQPVITDLSLRGLQVGGETELTIEGRGLTPETRIFLPFDFEQEVVSGNGNNRLTANLLLPETTIPGAYPLRVYDDSGLSNEVIVGVDRLPQQGPTDEVDLPVAITANVVGARILKTRFSAIKNQPIVVEVEASRLGSKLRPVVHVYDGRGKQVAFGPSLRSLNGDCRCAFRVPEKGEYSIEVHDFLFKGSSPGYCRVKIGAFDFADLCFPIGVEKDRKSVLRMIKVGADSEFLLEFTPKKLGWQYPDFSGRPSFSGPRPVAVSSSGREFLEPGQSADPVPAGKVPLAINGRLEKPREIDRFLVEVEPNSKLRFDLMGRRIGSTIDGRIRLKNEKGGVLAANDDRPGARDALLEYTVPGNLQKILVEVSDVTAKGSKSHVYRLMIDKSNEPAVDAQVDSNTINVLQNGNVVVPVMITRKNYGGPLEIFSEGLSSEYTLAGTTVASGSDRALIVISAASGSPSRFELKTKFSHQDRSFIGAVLPKLPPDAPLSRAEQRVLSVGTVAQASLDVNWLASVGQNQLSLGGQFRSRVALKRSESTKGPVRLRLLTSQKTPKKRIRKNNKDTFVDDLDRTIRAAEVIVEEGVNSADFPVQIPNDLSETDWDLVVVAEVLSKDKKKVLYSASSQLKTMAAVRQFEVKIESKRQLMVPAQGQAKLKLVGAIKRKIPGAPMKITLTDLPKGVTAQPTVVAAGDTEFEVTILLPVNEALLKTKKIGVEFSFLDPNDPDWVIGQASSATIFVKPEKESPSASK